MNTKKNFSILVLLFALCLCNQTYAQLSTPQPSPASTLTQKIGLTDFTVKYSRPGAKGRKIYGDIVPFGKIWRTGANSPTKISFTDDVTLEGNKVPAGEYTLLTMPDAAEWTVIINKDSKGNGAFSYLETDDVVRFKVKPQMMTNMVETFTINFTDITNGGANLEIVWEKTAIKVKIGVDYDTKVTAQIKKQLDPNRDAGLYAQVANYYLDQDKNLSEALELMTKSTDMAPRYWNVHTKAKIQMKLKDYKGAMASAEKSIGLAKEAKDDNYVRLNEKLIEECKKAAK